MVKPLATPQLYDLSSYAKKERYGELIELIDIWPCLTETE